MSTRRITILEAGYREDVFRAKQGILRNKNTLAEYAEKVRVEKARLAEGKADYGLLSLYANSISAATEALLDWQIRKATAKGALNGLKKEKARQERALIKLEAQNAAK